MLLALYPTKKACKEAIGTSFKYRETCTPMFPPEYRRTGTLNVANDPNESGIGHHWYGLVTLKDGIITKVK